VYPEKDGRDRAGHKSTVLYCTGGGWQVSAEKDGRDREDSRSPTAPATGAATAATGERLFSSSTLFFFLFFFFLFFSLFPGRKRASPMLEHHPSGTLLVLSMSLAFAQSNDIDDYNP